MTTSLRRGDPGYVYTPKPIDYEYALPFPVAANENAQPPESCAIPLSVIDELAPYHQSLATYVSLAAMIAWGEEISYETLGVQAAWGYANEGRRCIEELDHFGLVLWDEEHVKYEYGGLSVDEMRCIEDWDRARYRERAARHRPNPDGKWSGPWPFDEDTRYPDTGQAVVYLLRDEVDQVLYVGSTESFARRMTAHVKTGKRWANWTAEPYPDRQAAYDAESAYLAGFMPPLNVQGPRVRQKMKV